MTLQEAQILTLRVLKQVMEEKLDHHNVQLAQVRFAFHLHLLEARIWVSNTCITGHVSQRLRDTGRSEAEGSHRCYVISKESDIVSAVYI